VRGNRPVAWSRGVAGAIIALLQDRERAEAMGRAGRVEKCFTVERMGLEWGETW